MILIDGEERDHKEQPYSERQYVLIRKHLMKGSSAENLHKTELAFLFMSLTALMMSGLSSKLYVRKGLRFGDSYSVPILRLRWSAIFIRETSSFSVRILRS